jgi:hypothetical protein
MVIVCFSETKTERIFYRSQSLRFGLLALRSRFIGKPLPFDAQQGTVGARAIIIAGLDPVRVAEIELGEIAVKMALAGMLV